MSEIKRVPFSAALESDAWLDWEQGTVSDLLQHLRSDNIALRRLRDALSSDGEAVVPETLPA